MLATLDPQSLLDGFLRAVGYSNLEITVGAGKGVRVFDEISVEFSDLGEKIAVRPSAIGRTVGL